MQIDMNSVAELQHARLRMLVQFQCLPKPREPLVASRRLQILQIVLRRGAGKDQAVLGARGGDVKQSHAFKLFASLTTLAQVSKRRPTSDGAATIGYRDAESFVSIEHK